MTLPQVVDLPDADVLLQHRKKDNLKIKQGKKKNLKAYMKSLILKQRKTVSWYRWGAHDDAHDKSMDHILPYFYLVL